MSEEGRGKVKDSVPIDVSLFASDVVFCFFFFFLRFFLDLLSEEAAQLSLGLAGEVFCCLGRVLYILSASVNKISKLLLYELKR